MPILSVDIVKANGLAPAPAKRVKVGIQSTNIGILPFHVAGHKGFYREQGIDLGTGFPAEGVPRF